MKRLAFLLTVIGLALQTAHAQINLNSGLLGRFPFDGNSVDVSGNMGNSTDYSVTYAADARGQANGALRLNGSGRVDITPDGLLDFGTTGSFSFSVAFRTLSSGTQSFFTNRGNATASTSNTWPVGWRLGFDNTQVGKVYLDLFGFLPNVNASLGLATRDSFNDGLWHTAAITVNRSTQQIRMYVDGTAQALTYVSTNPTYGTVTGTVFQYGQQLAATMSLNPGYVNGVLVNSFGVSMNGSLDEARFYNRVLSVAEVQSLSSLVLATKATVVNDAIQVFPNPAVAGQFNVKLPAVASAPHLRVYTLTGQQVQPIVKQVAPQEMQVSGLETGLYMVRVEGAGQPFSRWLRVE